MRGKHQQMAVARSQVPREKFHRKYIT